MGNPFVYMELHADSVPKAKDFYQKLLDWNFEDMDTPAGPYTMIQVGEGTGGGMMKNQAPNAPSHWLPYIQVDDLTGATAKAKKLGADIVKDKTEVPNMGWFTVITDPAGAAVALWEPKL